jgi:hypothetical protein
MALLRFAQMTLRTTAGRQVQIADRLACEKHRKDCDEPDRGMAGLCDPNSLAVHHDPKPDDNRRWAK